MYRRALENYRDINDIRQVILNTHQIEQKWLEGYIANLPEPE